jgi:hypothetical protein
LLSLLLEELSFTSLERSLLLLFGGNVSGEISTILSRSFTSKLRNARSGKSKFICSGNLSKSIAGSLLLSFKKCLIRKPGIWGDSYSQLLKSITESFSVHMVFLPTTCFNPSKISVCFWGLQEKPDSAFLFFFGCFVDDVPV